MTALILTLLPFALTFIAAAWRPAGTSPDSLTSPCRAC
jgi:hypothetical protein